MRTGNILDAMVNAKRWEVGRAKVGRLLIDVQHAARDDATPRDFHASLLTRLTWGIHAMAEIMRKRPSAGLIRPDFDVAAVGRRVGRRCHGGDCAGNLIKLCGRGIRAIRAKDAAPPHSKAL